MPYHTTQHDGTLARDRGPLQEAFWTAVDHDVRDLLAGLLAQALEQVCTATVGVAWHSRLPARRAWRNGHYTRQLLTRYGAVPVRVPRLRCGGLDCSLLFDRYQRRQRDVDRVLQHAYLLGVSTRAAALLAEQLFGGLLSHQAVSRLGRWLDEALWRYRQRPLVARYPLVQLDGLHLGVCGGDQMAVLVVGLREDGRKDVLGFSLAPGEQCRELLWDLRRRGLTGVELFTSDGSGAIESALAEVYPETPRQICVTHKLRGLWTQIGDQPHRLRLVREAGRLFRQASGNAARAAARAWETKWWKIEPEAVSWFVAGWNETLTFYELPQHWWRKARTTNLVERLIRTLRMRLRPMGTFYDVPAAERALFGQLLRWHLIPETTQTT